MSCWSVQLHLEKNVSLTRGKNAKHVRYETDLKSVSKIFLPQTDCLTLITHTHTLMSLAHPVVFNTGNSPLSSLKHIICTRRSC